MFYQTVLQSVGNGTAVDTQGRRLSFIGYLQVGAGDVVWTDGNVIFGNATLKGTPNIAAHSKGVPILFGLEDEDIFTGYCTKLGRLKSKKIAIDDWIVNDKNNFQHGEKEIDGQKVIEAAIFRDKETQDNNVYVIAEGFYKKNQCVKYRNHLYVAFHTGIAEYIGKLQYVVLLERTAYRGEEIKLGVETADINQAAKIYKNDELLEEIDLQPYADFIAEECQAVKEEIMALSENNDANYMLQTDPPESFISSEYSRIISMRINEAGDWDAIIFASSNGYCFPYVLLNGSVFEPIFNEENGSVKTFSAKLAKCLDNLEKSVFTQNNFPFLQIEKYHAFNGTIIAFSGDLIYCLDALEQRLSPSDTKYSSDSTDPDVIVAKARYYLRTQPALADETGVSEKCTDEYKQYIEEKLKYYIPLVRFQFTEWFPVNFGGSCLLRVHNGEIISVMSKHIGGGGEVLSEYEWNETEGTYYTLHRFDVENRTEYNDWDYPLNDDFYLTGNGVKFKAIFDKNDSKIFDLTALNMNVGQNLEIRYPLRAYWDHKDLQVNFLATEEIPIEAFRHSYIYLPIPWYKRTNKDGITYWWYINTSPTNRTAPDGSHDFNENFFEELNHNLEDKENYFLMDGFFDTESDDGFFRFNPFICQLTDTNYLLGVHDGGLFVNRDGSYEQIADKLKNFRLCEMKNLSKAKEKSQ